MNEETRKEDLPFNEWEINFSLIENSYRIHQSAHNITRDERAFSLRFWLRTFSFAASRYNWRDHLNVSSAISSLFLGALFGALPLDYVRLRLETGIWKERLSVILNHHPFVFLPHYEDLSYGDARIFSSLVSYDVLLNRDPMILFAIGSLRDREVDHVFFPGSIDPWTPLKGKRTKELWRRSELASAIDSLLWVLAGIQFIIDEFELTDHAKFYIYMKFNLYFRNAGAPTLDILLSIVEYFIGQKGDRPQSLYMALIRAQQFLLSAAEFSNFDKTGGGAPSLG